MSRIQGKVLVLGSTGPAGICVLRELIYRNHSVVAFVRSPNKIPTELQNNSLLEVIQGNLDDQEALSKAVGQCSVVISLLGPQLGGLKGLDHAFFGNFYKNTLFPLMRRHGVRRIFAMGTPSYEDPGDRWVWMRPLIHIFFPLFAKPAYENIQNIAKAFMEEGHDIDWTIFRISMIPGGSDEQSWRADRAQGDTFVGYVGHPGWTISQKRGSLARWLVDAAETGLPDWVGKLPAVSQRAGSG